MIDLHPEVFTIFETTDPDVVIHKIAEQYTLAHDRALGLILGYPLPEIVGYEKARKQKISSVMEKLYNALPEDSPDKEILLNGYFDRKANPQTVIDCFVKQTMQRQVELQLQQTDLAALVEELRYQLNAKPINVYGVTWIEYAHSQESEHKQSRLKTAFETSGILDVVEK